ncbi:hypothetical protein MMC34_000723 [Xylographa carneopallida]|nr:hypothetical protein [Xylographa carneopallida]
MYERGTDFDLRSGNFDASQGSRAGHFDYANLDPELFLDSEPNVADTTTTVPNPPDPPTRDPLPVQDINNPHLPIPQERVLPFRPLHNTYAPAQALHSPEQMTFSEMVLSGWIQESDAYVLRLDVPSTLTPKSSHPHIPTFHTKVFHAYVTKVEAGKAFVSPDAVYLESMEVRDPQEIVETMGRQHFDHIGSFCEMQDPWILEVVRLGCSRGTLREDRERCWRWKLGW